MYVFRKMSRAVSLLVVSAFLMMGLQGASCAAMVGTDATINTDSVTKAQALLARKDVREHMVKMGVNPDDALTRISNLSNEEILALNGKLEKLPAGGDLLSTAALIFIILLFTDIMGYTDIFPFVKAKK